MTLQDIKRKIEEVQIDLKTVLDQLEKGEFTSAMRGISEISGNLECLAEEEVDL